MMLPVATSNTFFIAGGTLPPDAPSYIERPADKLLHDYILAGHLCYVLTSRQMGKSSLMARTADHLKKQGYNTVTIDLTNIGEVDSEHWYAGLVSIITKNLNLTGDVWDWWQKHTMLGPVQRFSNFLEEVVLTQTTGQVIIFIDEIDYTLSFSFSDDFFAALRATYNARAINPIYNRLTFVLLGSTTPNELIKDKKKTPFNVGQAIPLQSFSKTDAKPLQNELIKLYPQQGQTLFNRIFYWTNGHPFLTQQLCLTIANNAQKAWDEATIDDLVTNLTLDTKIDEIKTHFEFIQTRMLTHKNSSDLLDLYEQVYRGNKIEDEVQNPIHNELKLSGLVQKNEHGEFEIANRVYRNVFNQEWITSTNLNIPNAFSIRYLYFIMILTAMLTFTFIFSTMLLQPIFPENFFPENFLVVSPTILRIVNIVSVICLGIIFLIISNLTTSIPPNTEKTNKPRI